MIIYFNKRIFELELSDGEMGVVSYSERKRERERETCGFLEKATLYGV